MERIIRNVVAERFNIDVFKIKDTTRKIQTQDKLLGSEPGVALKGFSI